MTMSATRPPLGSNAVLSLLLVLACQAGADPSDGPGVAALAKGGGGQDPTVIAVDPTSAPQETTLDIRVLGTGFDNGSTARLLLDGRPVSSVKTNSTRFVSAGELVANVTIALEAPVATYDVEVLTLVGRRKGIGSEMFAVKPKPNADPNSHANWTFYSTMSDGTAARMFGDGRGLDGGPSPVPGESSYRGETCGIRGYIFTFGSGDAVFDPAFDPDGTPCGGRVMRADLGAGVVSFTPFTNAFRVHQMAENSQKVERLGLGGLNAATPCGSNNASVRLVFTAENLSGVSITRLPDENGARVWTVESIGNHLAVCEKTVKGRFVDSGLDVYLPFRAKIVEVPPPTGGW